MKAVTLASLSALALAGAACSETPAETKTQAPATQPVSAPADDGFNLRIPGETPTSAPANDGFNLRAPGQGPARTAPSDGFNLPAGAPAVRELNTVPEIDTSALAPTEDVVLEPDEDEIIRLDP